MRNGRRAWVPLIGAVTMTAVLAVTGSTAGVPAAVPAASGSPSEPSSGRAASGVTTMPSVARQPSPGEGAADAGATTLAARPQRSRIDAFARSASRRERAEIPQRIRDLGRDRAAASPVVDPATILVRYVPDTTEADRERAAWSAGGRTVASMPQLDAQVVEVDPADGEKVATRLRDDPSVELVEPNHLRTAAQLPDDAFVPTHLFTSRLPAAWDVTHGDPTTKIAILDSGVQLGHPDLASQLVAGYDFVNDDTDPSDDYGHGTEVAGVAAAKANNGIGIAGVAFDASIMPVKVLDSTGSGADGDIIDGINFAVGAGADVINMSLGGFGLSTLLCDAVANAVASGVVVIAASGNSGVDIPAFPAACPGAVAVGATDPFGDVIGFSNRGPWVDVVAQGMDITTTCAFNCSPEEPGYVGGRAGTSYASPVVAGVAALIKARSPSATPAQIEATLRSTAIDRGPRGIDDYYGAGLVDAYAAVGGRTAASPPQATRDASEPDDTFASAHAVAASHQATIAPEGDVDWYTVQATGAGTITFTVTPPTSDLGFAAIQTFDPLIDAWSPDGEYLGTFDAAGPGLPEVASLPVGSAGTYRFAVSNFVTSRSTGLPADLDRYEVSGSFAAGAPTPATPAGAIWVRDVGPAPFAEGVGAGVSPTVAFGRDLDGASVDAESVQLVDATTGAAVATTVAYNAETGTVTIDPVANLGAGKTYVVVVTGVADDASGVMEERFTSRFTVAAPPAPQALRADFNGDGFEDLAIGAPGEGLGKKTSAGGVHVLYGTSGAPSTSNDQFWSQDSPGIAGVAEIGDRFGEAIATGDLNNDGYDDLVVGVPFEDIGKKKDAGGVHVILGSASGLRAAGNQFWTQDSPGVPGGSEPNDRFGATLAVGAFDGAPGLDLAIGAPTEGIGSATNAGAVWTLSGSPAGLTGTGTKLWTKGDASLPPVSGDGFGSSLAAGDMQGDGNDELLIGIPGDDVFAQDEGSVLVVRGSVVGPRPIGLLVNFFSPLDPGERFGTSVALADVGGYGSTDGYGDIVVGAPGQRQSSKANAGSAGVYYVDHTELFINGQALRQSSFGADATESGARFGTSVSARSFRSSGVIAVGVPLDDVGSQADAGSVLVYKTGTAPASGLFSIGSGLLLHQDVAAIPGVARKGDRFCLAVRVLDVNGDGKADVACGSPFEPLSGKASAGTVMLFRDVLGSRRSAMYTQDTPGVLGSAEAGDRFGAAL